VTQSTESIIELVRELTRVNGEIEGLRILCKTTHESSALYKESITRAIESLNTLILEKVSGSDRIFDLFVDDVRSQIDRLNAGVQTQSAELVEQTIAYTSELGKVNASLEALKFVVESLSVQYKELRGEVQWKRDCSFSEGKFDFVEKGWSNEIEDKLDKLMQSVNSISCHSS